MTITKIIKEYNTLSKIDTEELLLSQKHKEHKETNTKIKELGDQIIQYLQTNHTPQDIYLSQQGEKHEYTCTGMSFFQYTLRLEYQAKKIKSLKVPEQLYVTHNGALEVNRIPTGFVLPDSQKKQLSEYYNLPKIKALKK